MNGLTEEEEVSSLWLAVREEGGVFGQEAVGARLVVLSIMIWSVTVDINCDASEKQGVLINITQMQNIYYVVVFYFHKYIGICVII